MKTTKAEIKRQLKGLWNNAVTVKSLSGKKYKVARVGWHDLQYKVIPLEATFDDVASRRYDKLLQKFYYKQELVDHLHQEFNQ